MKILVEGGGGGESSSDSDSDSDSNSDNEEVVKADKTNSDKAGMQLGFDLRGSLANISTWLGDDDDEDDDKIEKNTPVALTREALHQQCQAVVCSEESSNNSSDDAAAHGIELEKGPANMMTDKELIGLLKQQPKDVPEMKTRESFRRFFARMKKDRMEFLLRAANIERSTKEGEKKVNKRLALVKDILL